MYAAIVLLPLIIWGLFEPGPAASAYLLLAAIFEAYLLWDWKANAPRPSDPSLRSDLRHVLARRYHQFLSRPGASVVLSSSCSAISLASILWAILTLWNGMWLAAAGVLVTWYVATILASVLNPLHALDHATKRHPDAVMQIVGLRSLYRERHGEYPDMPDQTQGGAA